MSSPSDSNVDAESDEAEEYDDDDVAEGPLLVVVVDTSLIIEIKLRIGVNDQWELLDAMMEEVRAGRLAFPRRVHRELTNLRYPDAPGAWCGRAVKLVAYPEPAETTLVEILPAIQDLVEQSADDVESADPYVVAMAVELAREGFDVAVATTDRVDRLPLKIAVTTACERLGIVTWDFDPFVAWVRGERWLRP